MQIRIPTKMFPVLYWNLQIQRQKLLSAVGELGVGKVHSSHNEPCRVTGRRVLLRGHRPATGCRSLT